jgi:hypothetical protein
MLYEKTIIKNKPIAALILHCTKQITCNDIKTLWKGRKKIGK